jgi:hypothetical protein
MSSVECVQPTSNADPAVIAALDPLAQEALLTDAAVKAARGDIEAVAYAVGHLPASDPQVRMLQFETTTEGLADGTAQLALQTNSDTLWFTAMQAIEERISTHGERHALTLLQDTVDCAPTLGHLEEAFAIAAQLRDPYAQARALRAIARKQATIATAALGEGDGATQEHALFDLRHTRSMLHNRTGRHAMQAADEVNLDLVDFHAHFDERNWDAWRINGMNKQPHMKHWGRLKIAKYYARDDTEMASIVADITHHWPAYSVSNRLEIVDDCMLAGRFDEARELARRIPEGASSDLTHDARTMAYIRIARHQAGAGQDISGALAALDGLRTFRLSLADSRLGNSISLEEGTYLRHNCRRLREALAVADLITRHEIALTVPHNRHRAVQRVGLLAPYDFFDPRATLDDARATVARALAEHGHIEDAIRMANAISDDPTSAPEKSRTYTDIGKAVRAVRLANA